MPQLNISPEARISDTSTTSADTPVSIKQEVKEKQLHHQLQSHILNALPQNLLLSKADISKSELPAFVQLSGHAGKAVRSFVYARSFCSIFIVFVFDM